MNRAAVRRPTDSLTTRRTLAERVAKARLDAVCAVAVPDAATQLLHVCRRPA